MKKLFLILAFTCFVFLSYSQSKTEFGLTLEGSWFMPHQSLREFSCKSGFGTGVGIYASRNIFWRFSADIGLTYRYKQMQQHYTIYQDNGGYSGNTSGYGYSSENTIEGWKKYSLQYIVLPAHLQLLFSNTFFIHGGIEAGWLTNYDAGKDNPEFDWTLGFGSQKHKLKWSVNYIRGFKEVGFANNVAVINGYKTATVYRNNMLQLNLSFPIWQTK